MTLEALLPAEGEARWACQAMPECCAQEAFKSFRDSDNILHAYSSYTFYKDSVGCVLFIIRIVGDCALHSFCGPSLLQTPGAACPHCPHKLHVCHPSLSVSGTACNPHPISLWQRFWVPPTPSASHTRSPQASGSVCTPIPTSPMPSIPS